MTAKKPLTKAQMMQAACAQFDVTSVHKVDGVAPLEVYVKVFTAKEFRDLSARGESFDEHHDDGYNDERRMALELFDAEGRPLFDPENMEDVLFLANLPFGVRQTISLASAKTNAGGWLKNL